MDLGVHNFGISKKGGLPRTLCNVQAVVNSRTRSNRTRNLRHPVAWQETTLHCRTRDAPPTPPLQCIRFRCLAERVGELRGALRGCGAHYARTFGAHLRLSASRESVRSSRSRRKVWSSCQDGPRATSFLPEGSTTGPSASTLGGDPRRAATMEYNQTTWSSRSLWSTSWRRPWRFAWAWRAAGRLGEGSRGAPARSCPGRRQRYRHRKLITLTL